MSSEKKGEVPRIIKYGALPLAGAAMMVGGVKNIEASRADSQISSEAKIELHTGQIVFETPQGERLVPLSVEGGENKLGDVDCNFKINSVDALKTLQHIAGQIEGGHECVLNSQIINLINADVDRDYGVDSVDALLILKHTAGIIDLENLEVVQSVHGIDIRGSEYFVSRVEQALDILKDEVPSMYENVVSDVGIIDSVYEGTGMYAWEEEPRMALGDQTVEAHIDWLAATLVHEWKHLDLYIAGEDWFGAEAEGICMEVQMEVLKSIDAPQNLIDHLQEIIDSGQEYWNDADREWRKKELTRTSS